MLTRLAKPRASCYMLYVLVMLYVRIIQLNFTWFRLFTAIAFHQKIVECVKKTPPLGKANEKIGSKARTDAYDARDSLVSPSIIF